MKQKIVPLLMALVLTLSAVASPVTASAASAPKATALVSIASPKAKQIKVKWKKQSGITGYQLQYSTSKKYAKKSTATVKIKKAKTTSKTLNKLKAGKKYYVHIRTYQTKNGKTKYSKWSKTKSVTVKKASATASTYSEAQTAYTFRYDSYLDEHYQKHKADTQSSSKQEYLCKANAVITDKDALHKTEADDGDDIYYLEASNEMVIVSTDGYIRTYFCPDNGKSYYDRQ